MASTTLNIIDGGGVSRQINAETNGTSFTFHSALEVAGAAVASSNALPVNDATAIAGIGGIADAAYGGSGNSSVVAALKGLYALLTSTISVFQKAVALTDRSIASPAVSASTQLLASNANRHSLSVQAPQATGVWLNLAGGTAAANGSGCIFLTAGTLYEPQVVFTNAVTYFITSGAQPIVVLEG